MNIRYVQRKDIDTQKWDHCVKNASCTLPYALSEFLDCTCSKQWAALVADNYQAVMPLPYKSKLGISYVFQPFLSQQLGIYAQESLSEHQVERFIQAIPHSFSYIDTFLNYTNPKQHRSTRCNLILSLNAPYNELQSHYSNNAKRNIQKAVKCNLSIEWDVDVNIALAFANMHIDTKPTMYPSECKDILLQFMNTASISKYMQWARVMQNNVCMAQYLLITYRDRIITLFVCISDEAKVNAAAFLMIDAIIQKYANTDTYLDFEGSEIPGVKRFYMQFNPNEQSYSHMKLNKLPLLLKWLKK